MESRISARLPPTWYWMEMAVTISSRSSDFTRRTRFSRACSNGRPRFTSRMTRWNSVEIGGRASRTTSSIACRKDEPARRAFAIRVMVSGSCLLNWLRRLPWRRRTYQRGRKKPITAPTRRRIGFWSAGRAKPAKNMRTRHADDRADPDEEVLGDLQLEVGPGELAGQVGPEVPPLDGLVELREGGALGDQVAQGPGAGLGRLRLVLAGGVALQARADAGPAARRGDPDGDQEDGERRDGGDDDGHWHGMPSRA